MSDIQEIKILLKKMYPLLIKGEDHMWAEPIRIWYAQIEQFPEEAIRDIIRCSFGRDSLYDLHITKDAVLLKDEDREFCSLRNRLVEICENILPEISKAKKPQEPDLS